MKHFFYFIKQIHSSNQITDDSHNLRQKKERKEEKNFKYYESIIMFNH